MRFKPRNCDLSLNILEMCDSASSISLEKSVLSKFQYQGSKVSLSVAGILGSQDVKTGIVLIIVSAHEKFRPLKTVQLYLHEKLKLGDQTVELQELKDRYPHLRNLPNQTQSKRCSSDSWRRLFLHPSPFRFQEVRRQSCNMGSEIKNWLGFKWSAANEASSNPRHINNINCR